MAVHFLPRLQYPESERSKLEALGSLFQEWHRHIADTSEGGLHALADKMVFDGFYPCYFSSKPRILFIGLEARQIATYNYIEMLHEAYRKGKRIGKQALGQSLFHSRMLKMAYGIQNGMCGWNEIPSARKIGATFALPGAVSFAFMNVCKISNEAASHQADGASIWSFYQRSRISRNFYDEQVALLEPDVVITMNFQGRNLLPFSKERYVASARRDSWSWLDLNDRRALLIDAFHFSAWNKRDTERHYYAPICKAIRESELLPAGDEGIHPLLEV